MKKIAFVMLLCWASSWMAPPANAIPCQEPCVAIPAGSSDGLYIPGQFNPAFIAEEQVENTLYTGPLAGVTQRPEFNNFYGILLASTGESASDLIYYDGTGIHFVSDGESGGVITGIVTITATLQETGNWQDVGQYFFSSGQAVWAFSDVEVTATPLPAALPLFAGGLGVMGLLARRRKRKAS